MTMRKLLVAVLALPIAWGSGCGEGCNPGSLFLGDDRPPGSFGETTSTVVLVNPIINEGSSTSVVPGIQRAGVSIQAASLPAVDTDATGLAVIENLPTGVLPLSFPTGDISLAVVDEGDLYDVVVSFTAGGVQEIFPAVRYPIGGTVVVVNPGGSIEAAASEDDTIVVLGEGEYPGGFELRKDGVLIFGAWSPTEGPLSTIEGDVDVLGFGVRIRGVRITGRLTSRGNNFSAAFCDLTDADIQGNGILLLRNIFTEGQAIVPSSNAVLVDNLNIP